MWKFIAFKEYAFTTHRRNILQMIFMMDAQFAAVIRYPVLVEVHDHRILSDIIVSELINMLFVKSILFIHGVMEFISCNPCITSPVQVNNKGINEVQKMMFMGVIMAPVQPVYFVASYCLIMRYQDLVSNACGKHLVISV